MMQFTETLAAPPPHQCGARPWPPLRALGGSFAGDAGCMEQLLVHCANAIESNDSTLAQQILWVLNNIALPDGDANQRLAAGFLRALIARAARTGSCKQLTAAMANAAAAETHKFSVIELAGFVDITPWHRFGFSAANAAILDAIDGFAVVHLVDLSATHCMQLPTLIDALAGRPDGAPFLKLTVSAAAGGPLLTDFSYNELGSRLINFARSRNVRMDFKVVNSSPADGFASLIDHLRSTAGSASGEALIINCQLKLHYIPEETLSALSYTSFRTLFLESLRSLDPTLVVLVEEDADLTAGDVVSRLKAAFNYLWIPYDTVDTFLVRGSCRQREWYEAEIGWKIENVVAAEGAQRVERLEGRGRWVKRMQAAGFREVALGEEAAAEVKAVLDEHAAGWGLKRKEDCLLLTWKGHTVVFATAWVPAP